MKFVIVITTVLLASTTFSFALASDRHSSQAYGSYGYDPAEPSKILFDRSMGAFSLQGYSDDYTMDPDTHAQTIDRLRKKMLSSHSYDDYSRLQRYRHDARKKIRAENIDGHDVQKPISISRIHDPF